MTANLPDRPEIRPPFFVRVLNYFFVRCGYFVADYDKAVLIATLLFSVLCSSKIAFTKQEDDIKMGYTPYGARSLDEIASYNEYFSSKGEPIAVFLFITAKDNGSMSRYPYMKEAIEIMDIVGSNLTHKNLSFYSICSDFCIVNEPVRQFYNGLLLRESSNSTDAENQENDRILLTFPLMEVLGKELDLSPNFFGVRTVETNHSLEYLKIVMMQFRANPPEGWVKDDVQAYERMLSTYFHKQYKSELVNTYALSLTYTGDEIVRTGLTIFPYIAVGFSIMSVFSIVTVYYSSSKMHQLSIHKLTLALFGCVCPLLATSSALGLLFWCGFRFSTILAVTPFLILAIGVDDAFLMINSWMRITNKDKSMTRRERIACILVDVGPSVTITSLTNFLAFIVGIWTPTPEIQLFCAGNAVAILFDFFYQITMYVALMSITGDYEMRNEHKKKDVKWDPLENETYIRLLDDYSQWLANKFTALLLGLAVFVYLLVSIRGAMQIEIKLTPDKLVLSSSPLIEMNHLRDQFVLPNYTIVNIFVQKPGNLSEPAQLQLADRLIEDFESIPECLGAKFSHYFVRDYLLYEQMAEGDEGVEIFEEEDNLETETSTGLAMSQPDKFSRQAMVGFLSWPEFQHWNGFVRFNENGTINRFWATVSYHGDMLGDFNSRKKFLKKWRSIADSYPTLNVSIFDDYAPFVDTLETILPGTISTSLCTLICMMLVCFLFMYNLFTVIVATLAITSICIGVFGFLSYWHVDLDPISMATTIMSIGFSVDFPAHITFHYFREGLEEPDSLPYKRVARSLAAIGFPLLQCGISTILFVLCLLFVSTYMSEVFVKTMFLVVSLGLIHGLVLVPAFLCALTDIHKKLIKRKLSDNQSFSSLAKLFAWKISPSSSEGKISNNSN